MRYLASCRSNYVQLKDTEALRSKLPATYRLVESTDSPGKHAVIPAGAGGAFWPGANPDGDEATISLLDLIASELVSGEIVVVIEVGVGEGLEYIVGFADAGDSEGRRARVDLNEIYHKAAEKLGGELAKPVSRAEF